ncbi:hypothetical protein RPD_2915 [Rhodopseudomonas palustris BisB5]|uniref:Uncharacterized protein n=1 Tax=Rhodopseudomonas palustris (strain BisB5) TaxID=316057 RepID=Q135U6_RHOPS|nr:hypothetical protein RPD_2915 [Rhodopseudomonas palustris BisB5]
MWALIKANYKTYHNSRTGTREGYLVRLFGSAAVSFASAYFLDIAANSGMMVTALSVLTGFVFTALCSDHSLADAKLPVPSDETQRAELERLGALAINFQTRSAYFITLAICNLCLLVLISTSALSANDLITFEKLRLLCSYSRLAETLPIVVKLIRVSLSGIAAFMFIECVYTFYRLSETTLAIVDARRDYLRPDF